MPLDQASQKHRGFGFVEFELAGDAKAAIENMNNSELFGRVLKVNLAKPMAGNSFKPLWEQEEYLRSRYNEDGSAEEANTSENKASGDAEEPASKKQKTQE